MKAKDLMIGDWVHVEAHRGFNAQNVKVETIPDNDGDNEYGHHYGHIGAWLESGDNDFRDVEARHLQPIPLTDEILERNEWKRVKAFGFDDTMVLHIDGHAVLWWGVNNKDVVLLGGGGFNIKYVHEMQHLMKMCGIEKEIEL